MISHKLNEIAAIADRITILRDGRTIETLDVAGGGVSRGPDHPRDGRPRPRAPLPARDPQIGEVLFEVEGLERSTTRWTQARPRSSSTRTSWSAAGEVVGIAGLMGAGRTELAMSLRAVLGHAMSAARVVLEGKELELNRGRGANAAGIAYVTEDRKSLRPEPDRRHQDLHHLGRLSTSLGPRLTVDGERGGRGSPTSTGRS
jgi:putative multiple sugar transport system ATP-binding protein